MDWQIQRTTAFVRRIEPDEGDITDTFELDDEGSKIHNFRTSHKKPKKVIFQSEIEILKENGSLHKAKNQRKEEKVEYIVEEFEAEETETEMEQQETEERVEDRLSEVLVNTMRKRHEIDEEFEEFSK